MKLPRNIRRSVHGRNRWKKGESGASNPEINMHRKAAKSGGTFLKPAPPSLGSIPLTRKALDKLDIGMSETTADDEVISVADTFRSWATSVTQCSNPIFNRVMDPWAGNTAQQREALAVLAGVTQTLQEKGGKESNTEYFAALLLCLESVEDTSTQSAIGYLLKTVMTKGVPEAVLRSAFGKTVKPLLNLLQKSAADETQTALTKAMLFCLGHLLRVQEAQVWTYSSTRQVYNSILQFITHEKPTVRRAAQRSVTAVLRSWSILYADRDPPPHPASADTERFTSNVLAEERRAAGASLKTGEVGLHRLLYVLDFLKESLCVMPAKHLQTSAESLLEVLRLPNVMLHCKVLEVFRELLCSAPAPSCLPLTLCGQLCSALFTHQPGNEEAETTRLWLAALSAGIAHMTSLDEGSKIALPHLSRLITQSLALLISPAPVVRSTAFSTVNRLITEVLPDLITQLPANSITPLFSSIRSAMGYHYHEAWSQVLRLLASFIRVWGSDGTLPTGSLLGQLVDIRLTENTALVGEVDNVVATAIEVYGPRMVLGVVPLGIEEDLAGKFEFRRSWLLPLLRNHVKSTEASYFHEAFFPLSNRIQDSIKKLQSEGRQNEAAVWSQLRLQLWATLPGFCTDAKDWGQLKSSDGLLVTMAAQLEAAPELRGDVMAGLRKLLFTASQQEEAKKVMKLFAKLFVPKLLGILETSDDDEDPKRLKQMLNHTLDAYFPLVNKKMLHSACLRALSKSLETKCNIYLDMLIVMVPHLSQDSIGQVLEETEPFMKGHAAKLQKKAYRLLEEVCRSNWEEAVTYTTSHIDLLLERLKDSMDCVKPPNKKSRFHCYLHLIGRMAEPHTDVFNSLLPEALMSLRDINSKARSAAANLLVQMVVALARWRTGSVTPGETPDTDTLSECLSEFLQRLWPILSPDNKKLAEMTAHAVACLFRSRELAGAVTSEHADGAIDVAIRLLKCEHRELAILGVELIRLLARYVGRLITLERLLEPLHNMNELHQLPLRFNVKAVMAKLVKKFSLKVLQDLVPSNYTKMLTNSFKMHARSERKKKDKTRAGASQLDDSDDEDTDMKTSIKNTDVNELLQDTDSEGEEKEGPTATDSKESRKTKKKQQNAPAGWLEEAAGEIIDMADSAAISKRLHAGQVSKTATTVKKRADPFKMRNGKLVIEDEDERPEAHVKSKKRKNAEDSEEELRAVDDPDSDPEPSAKKYRPGGVGLHRDTKKQSIPGAQYRSSKAAGDMKKPGRPDPYAYLPLSQSSSRGDKKFRSLMKTVCKGVARGKKAARMAQSKHGGKRRR